MRRVRIAGAIAVLAAIGSIAIAASATRAIDARQHQARACAPSVLPACAGAQHRD